MDPFRLCVALVPLAIYLIVLGWMNFTRRPMLVAGARDTAALGVALSGLMLVGPLELFAPESTLSVFGRYAWPLLLLLYGMIWSLVVLLERPRLVVYNMSLEELRPVLAGVIDFLDSDARWAGCCLAMPRLQVELNVESQKFFRNVSLTAASHQQSYQGWRELELALGARLRSVDVQRNLRGASLGLAGFAAMAVVGWLLISDPQEIWKQFEEMMRWPPAAAARHGDVPPPAAASDALEVERG